MCRYSWHTGDGRNRWIKGIIMRSENLLGDLLYIIGTIVLLSSGIHGILKRKEINKQAYTILSIGQIAVGVVALISIILFAIFGKL